jgi:hypothetical protein
MTQFCCSFDNCFKYLAVEVMKVAWEQRERQRDKEYPFDPFDNMVCVVPLLLKRNIGVLFGVLRGPRSDAPFFACYSSAIVLWVLYIYIYIYIYTLIVFPYPPNLLEIYLMRSYLYRCNVQLLPLRCVLRYCFAVCCVAYLYPCGHVRMS